MPTSTVPTSTAEDYLKAILLEEQRRETGELVTMGQISSALSVAPGTVTAMVKTLERGGHLRYEPYAGVRLSEEGRQLAVRVLRRHRLIELFLVEVLGFDWSEVHEEAERLEHVVSDKLVERIDAFLGHPGTDPHGDPIPSVAGEIAEARLFSLAECPAGESFRIARVSDQDEAFLRFAERHGLKPGERVVVEERDPMAMAVTLRAGGRPRLTLGQDAAAKLWVERPEED